MKLSTGKDDKQFVSSLARGCNLLDTICKSPTPLGLSQLAIECRLSVSTIQRLTFTLMELGLIYRDRKTKKFHAGPRAIALAFALIDNSQLKKSALPIMQDLAEETDEVVGLCALSGNHVILLEIILKNQKIININLNPGDIMPINASASGKVMLAFLEEHQRKTLLKNFEPTKLTNWTITSIEKLEDQLVRARRMGYAITIDEGAYGLSAIAAPVHGSDNEVIAALAIMTPTTRTTRRDAIINYKEKIINAADQISKGIGYQKLRN